MTAGGIARILRITLTLCVASAADAFAGPLALSDTPLAVSTSIDPNVMLLIDNSGSMEHMTWHEDYVPGNDYGDWQFYSSALPGLNNAWANISTDDSAVPYHFPNNLRRDSCADGYSRFRRGNAFKCLRLPSPNGVSNTRYQGSYLRFLLDRFPDGTDLTQGQIPGDIRMKVARDVARDLVQNTSGMRFGVSRFNYGYITPSVSGSRHGGSIIAPCGSDTNTLVDRINELNADNWTPLAESLYEITRYFRGLSSHYNAGNYTSPIRYRCQKNFTIVITDGLPTYDGSFPANDPDDPDHKLPNWDGIDNDGPNPTIDRQEEGHSLLLDDIAKFAWDIDMRKGGTDEVGISFDDPVFPKQNMYTYTVGFAISHQMLEDAARYGNGIYLTANNAEQLRDRLGEALTDIQSKLGSASSAAASSGFISAGTKVYQGRMNSEFWTGQLLAFALNTTPGEDFGQLLRNGPGPEGSLWDAGSLIGGARTIITNKAGGIPFRWNAFTDTERNDYFNGQQNLLEYLRGAAVAGYRNRPSLLGDIVNSAPQYAAAPSARYPDSLETAPYSGFKQAQANRTPMIYVGANDGMLHGFDAETGVERLAYIPGHLLGKLKNLSAVDNPATVGTDESYEANHRFYVDGTPTVVDAFIGGAWKTVLAGGLNNGGQAIYALDVTNPAQFSENNAHSIFLWEFTDADDADLGYTYSQPAIVRLHNGAWAAVFGNGYNNTTADGHASTTGNAALYIVDLRTGALIKKISTGVGTAQDPTGEERPNGLATVAPVDLDGDNLVDYVYAGDLFGNLWKFDLRDDNAGNWALAYKLFEACAASPCTTTNHQPITTAPTVIRHPNLGGQIVLFGTGKYLERTDNVSENGGVQSFYGIWDRNSSASMPVARGLLQQQRILYESTYTFIDPDGEEIEEGLRVTTDHAVNWTNQRGWYIDLVSPHGFEGERQVTDPLVRNGRLVFTTMIPSNTSDPCAPAGTSWIMEMNAVGGARLTYSPFDLDRDSQFSASDYVTVVIDGETVRVPATGRKTKGGHAQTPTVVSADGMELKYVSTSDGLEVIVENPGHLLTGRQSWRELFLQ